MSWTSCGRFWAVTTISSITECCSAWSANAGPPRERTDTATAPIGIADAIAEFTIFDLQIVLSLARPA
jgi:hypothetical protein